MQEPWTEEELALRLALVWVMRGDQRYTTREGRVNKREARALIGFQDGTANLDPKNVAADANLVFVNPDTVGQYPKLPAPNHLIASDVSSRTFLLAGR